MSILDRILLFILSLASLCLGVVLALVGANVFGSDTVMMMSSAPVNLIAIVAGIVIVLIALRFLFYRVKRPQLSDFVAMAGENGQIRISHDTIRQLANRRGAQVKGTEALDTRIRQGQDGIIILVRSHVLPDIDIAQMSREIQTSIKEYIETTTGITVESVVVHVAELSSSPKQGKAWSGV